MVNRRGPRRIEVSEWKNLLQPIAAQFGEQDHVQHSGVLKNRDKSQSTWLLLLGADTGIMAGQNFVVVGGMTRKVIANK